MLASVSSGPGRRRGRLRRVVAAQHHRRRHLRLGRAPGAVPAAALPAGGPCARRRRRRASRVPRVSRACAASGRPAAAPRASRRRGRARVGRLGQQHHHVRATASARRRRPRPRASAPAARSRAWRGRPRRSRRRRPPPPRRPARPRRGSSPARPAPRARRPPPTPSGATRTTSKRRRRRRPARPPGSTAGAASAAVAARAGRRAPARVGRRPRARAPAARSDAVGDTAPPDRQRPARRERPAPPLPRLPGHDPPAPRSREPPQRLASGGGRAPPRSPGNLLTGFQHHKLVTNRRSVHATRDGAQDPSRAAARAARRPVLAAPRPRSSRQACQNSASPAQIIGNATACQRVNASPNDRHRDGELQRRVQDTARARASRAGCAGPRRRRGSAARRSSAAPTARGAAVVRGSPPKSAPGRPLGSLQAPPCSPTSQTSASGASSAGLEEDAEHRPEPELVLQQPVAAEGHAEQQRDPGRRAEPERSAPPTAASRQRDRRRLQPREPLAEHEVAERDGDQRERRSSRGSPPARAPDWIAKTKPNQFAAISTAVVAEDGPVAPAPGRGGELAEPALDGEHDPEEDHASRARGATAPRPAARRRSP